MTSKQEHLWRTGLIALVALVAGLGAYFFDGELRAACLGLAIMAVTGLGDAVRVLLRGADQ